MTLFQSSGGKFVRAQWNAEQLLQDYNTCAHSHPSLWDCITPLREGALLVCACFQLNISSVHQQSLRLAPFTVYPHRPPCCLCRWQNRPTCIYGIFKDLFRGGLMSFDPILVGLVLHLYADRVGGQNNWSLGCSLQFCSFTPSPFGCVGKPLCSGEDGIFVSDPFWYRWFSMYCNMTERVFYTVWFLMKKKNMVITLLGPVCCPKHSPRADSQAVVGGRSVRYLVHYHGLQTQCSPHNCIPGWNLQIQQVQVGCSLVPSTTTDMWMWGLPV